MPSQQAPGRVGVLGDIGGHSHALRGALTKLGVTFALRRDTRPQGQEWEDVELTWPADLHVVSVGDLVHRGPDSLGVLVLIDRLIQAGHWTQVVGNHEQLYVSSPVFTWHETIPAHGIALLRQWWENGTLGAAAAITSPHGEHLVTHAGLTHGFWALVLNRPDTATAAAAKIAETVATGTVWLPGAMLGYDHNLAAGPVWAEAGSELVASWHLAPATDAPGFDQVHGHTAPFDWDRRTWRAPESVQHLIALDAGRRHTTTTVAGHRIVGIDPDHGTHAASVFAPLLINDAAVDMPTRHR